ncbi:hypothetical protein B0H12DRAFT_1142292 [Mycena haematopus]|nr:hypothetical protein B0H12DRAFT_1142292 [Mycena haematopus]
MPLECQASPAILELRREFLSKLQRAVPKMQKLVVELDPIAQVLEVFYATPIYRG